MLEWMCIKLECCECLRSSSIDAIEHQYQTETRGGEDLWSSLGFWGGSIKWKIGHQKVRQQFLFCLCYLGMQIASGCARRAAIRFWMVRDSSFCHKALVHVLWGFYNYFKMIYLKKKKKWFLRAFSASSLLPCLLSKSWQYLQCQHNVATTGCAHWLCLVFLRCAPSPLTGSRTVQFLHPIGFLRSPGLPQPLGVHQPHLCGYESWYEMGNFHFSCREQVGLWLEQKPQ